MNHPDRGHGWVTGPRILLCTLALLTATTGGAILASAAGTTVVNDTADAWVDAGNPSVNHGATTYLQIDNSPDLHAYLMFNVAVPAGEHVTSAQLTVRPNQSNTGGFEVHSSDATWSESTITYANAPAVGATVYGGSGPVTAGVDASVDVTPAIPAAGGTLSLVLVNRTGTSYSVKAREAGASTAPRLTVTTATNPPAAPTASFTASPTSGSAPLTVQFTDTSTGGPTGWSWDFGDGTTSTQQSPSHVFQSTGTYTVNLTASNAGGNSTASTTITANAAQPPPSPPTARFTASPTSGTAPLSVAFTDTSTGGPTAWSWDFGDGATSTQQNPSHVFQSTGTYTVNLTASNAAGNSTASTTITVSPQPPPSPPTASFTATPTSGAAPLTVQFTDTSTGGATGWSWAFGDGATSTQQNPSHIFQNTGIYTVTLTASNAGGSTSASQAITVNASQPVASFTSSTSNGPAPLSVQFTDTSSGVPTSWSWSFGDGGRSSQQNPSYVYRTAGTYTATLTATNALGSSTATKTIAVSPGSTNIGYRDQSYSGGPDAVTGEKPESKLWINDGIWWADMFDSASNTFHIFRLDRSTEQWVDTGTPLDNRVQTKADTLWDGTHLYVASHVIAASSANSTSGNPARLYRLSYNSSTQTYSLDAGFPVNINNYSSETLVVTEDSLGDIWATWAQSSKIYAARSGPGGTNWASSFTLPTSGASGVSSDDISAIVTVGSAQVGVMWSNQSSGTLYFGVHSDLDRPNQHWNFKVLQSGAHSVDDHINLKQLDRDTSGRLYAVVKTSYNDVSPPNPNAPLINVWVRDTSGNWTSYVFGRVADNHTRAVLMLDSSNQMIYVFATGPSTYGDGSFQGTIYMKRTPMSAISFAPGLGTPVIRDAKSAAMNNATSTKQTVTNATGLVVVASNDSTDQYWHADIALAP